MALRIRPVAWRVGEGGHLDFPPHCPQIPYLLEISTARPTEPRTPHVMLQRQFPPYTLTPRNLCSPEWINKHHGSRPAFGAYWDSIVGTEDEQHWNTVSEVAKKTASKSVHAQWPSHIHPTNVMSIEGPGCCMREAVGDASPSCAVHVLDAGASVLGLFGGAEKPRARKPSARVMEEEEILMQALADEEEDVHPDDGAIEIDSDEEYQ
ncbi:hypothetical protein B0H10DRAFT_1948751 [Mycena sp. CBHHK59/15]|nr:hypothetical protein B0H10DRAFT_1948751 [Mycena sp. CBHHK59/15]